MAAQRTVMVLGATGLVGRELLRALLRDPSVARVVAPARRPVEVPEGIPDDSRDKLLSRVVDFTNLEASAGIFAGVSQIFSALGTTIRAAGSRARFRQVDHDFPIAAARLGLQHGATHYLLVSALGADPSSRVFYSRVKGEMERDLLGMGYRSVTIVRPSLLLGERDEFRLGEAVAKRLAWAIPQRWAPVSAGTVAATLAEAAAADREGTRIIESREVSARLLPVAAP